VNRGGPLVVGLGHPDRGDDAVGLVVAREVAARALPGVRVAEHEDPMNLLDLWQAHEPVVVVDAVRSGAAPGTLHRLATGADSPRLSERSWSRAGLAGSHGLGLAEAIELARALQALPTRLTVVGVEATCFDHGAPLSSPVAAAVTTAADEVVRLVRR
jgi:hydrogenase maturation protease